MPFTSAKDMRKAFEGDVNKTQAPQAAAGEEPSDDDKETPAEPKGQAQQRTEGEGHRGQWHTVQRKDGKTKARKNPGTSGQQQNNRKTSERAIVIARDSDDNATAMNRM